MTTSLHVPVFLGALIGAPHDLRDGRCIALRAFPRASAPLGLPKPEPVRP